MGPVPSLPFPGKRISLCPRGTDIEKLMEYSRSIVSFLALVLFVAHPVSASGPSVAEDSDSSSKTTILPPENEFPFEKGATELQVVAGPFFHLAPTGNPRPRTNFIQSGLRYGWMLSSPGSQGLLRGNFEFLLEGFGAGIFEGPGNYLVGADMMFRYNFVQPGARLIPYLQTVTGGLYNDVYKTETQALLDTPGEFYLGADVGLRWMMRSNFGVTCEVGYRHISNANIGDVNLGLNSLGVTFGVSFFF